VSHSTPELWLDYGSLQASCRTGTGRTPCPRFVGRSGRRGHWESCERFAAEAIGKKFDKQHLLKTQLKTEVPGRAVKVLQQNRSVRYLASSIYFRQHWRQRFLGAL
jgi:hypothetical protein